QVADALRAQEAWVVRSCGDHDHGQDRQDAQLADPEHDLGEVAGAPAARRRRLPLRALHRDAHPPPSVAMWPVAANMTVSSEASWRDSSAVSRPSCITSTRSAMPRTSGSSEEIIR